MSILSIAIIAVLSVALLALLVRRGQEPSQHEPDLTRFLPLMQDARAVRSSRLTGRMHGRNVTLRGWKTGVEVELQATVPVPWEAELRRDGSLDIDDCAPSVQQWVTTTLGPSLQELLGALGGDEVDAGWGKVEWSWRGDPATIDDRTITRVAELLDHISGQLESAGGVLKTG